MKQLKDRAKKDRQEIVESKKAIVLRAELQRQVEEKMEELRLAEAARHRKIRAIGLTSTAGLLLVLSIGIGVVMLINDSYVSTYSSKPSDIAFLNENLTNTQVKGNFNAITLTYEVRRNTLEYFVLVDEQEEPDISHKDVTIHIVVDRGYSEVEEKIYTEKTEFLGYTLQYSETQRSNPSPDGTTLYGYKVEACMDTGAEKYILEYYEYRADTAFTFTEYLQATITQKYSET